MKKYEILYDWPVAEITRLADSTEAESFAENLSEPEQSKFVSLTERMRMLGVELVAAKAARQHFPKWSEIQSCLELFGQQFATFPDLSIEKFRLSVIFADKLFQLAPVLDAVEINKEVFEIRAMTNPISISWFCRENRLSLQESMALFSCVDMDAVQNEIAGWNLSPDFVFHFLATLHGFGELPERQAVLIKKTTPQTEIKAVDAFVRMVVLATGVPVHSAREYLCAPFVLEPDEIRVGHPYQQWGDVLNVLSEYNSRKDVLLKYLTIYHVVENFMFKRPIVELETQKNGQMFSIRDFRALYENVSLKEPAALANLMITVFKMPAKAGVTFESYLVTRWAALVPGISQVDLNSALHDIGMTFTFGDFHGQGIASKFSKLVYAVRNAIVHNKETELHLTYASMNANVCTLIENFLLPSLEEICFALICKPNAELWYQNRELQLYR